METINKPKSFNDVARERHLNLNNLMLTIFSIDENVVKQSMPETNTYIIKANVK